MAGQDIKKLLAPGQSQPVQVGGDFIFMKTADRPITVIINGGESSGSRVTMTAGDKYRPGNFKSFEIENTDAENAAEIVITVGRGDYNRQTVTGQITTRLGILTGSGDYIDDTRSKLKIDAITVPGTGITEAFGELKAEPVTGFDITLPDGGKFGGSGVASYNQNINDGMIVYGRSSKNNTATAAEIDVLTGALVRSITLPNLGILRSITRWGGLWFAKWAEGNNSDGIYIRRPSGTWEQILSDRNNFDAGITADKEGNIYFSDWDKVIKIDQQGNKIAESDPCGWLIGSITQDAQGRIWVFPDANYVPKVFTEELEFIRQLDGVFRSYDGVGIYGAYAVRYRDPLTNIDEFKIYAMETVTNKLAGRGYLQCQNAWLGPRPNALSAMRSDANVTVFNGETGNPTVSGELIKLVMEWYLGHPVPINYMDYLHGIRITGGTDMEGISYPPVHIESNGQTLLAAKIPDNFTQVFPIRVEATIDTRINEL